MVVFCLFLFFFCFLMEIKFCLSSRKANLSLEKDKSFGTKFFCGVHFCFHLEMAACILFSSHVVDLMP